MIKLYLKTALLSIIGFLLTNTTAVPMDRFIQDDEMPDNYKGIELEEEEETSTNPHNGNYSSLHTTAGVDTDWIGQAYQFKYNRRDLINVEPLN